jgi:uncharacterized protein (TIGR01244 family)
MTLTITKHSETFSSSPQITADDIREIASQGYKTIINARPDNEGGQTQPTSNSIKEAAEKAGLSYIHIPVIPNNIQSTDIAICASYINSAPVPVLGFCKTGMRATNLYQKAKQANNPETAIAKQNWLMQKVSNFFQNKCLLTKLYRKLTNTGL